MTNSIYKYRRVNIYKYRKLIDIGGYLLILIIAFFVFYLLSPRMANAEVPVKCEKCSKENTLKDFSKKETENTRNIFNEQLKEFNFMRNKESIKRNLFNMILNQIQQWILGKGGSGDCTISGINGLIKVPCNQTNQPKYVTDWKQYVADANRQGANAFINSDFGGVTFCPSDGGIDTGPVIKDYIKQEFTATIKDAYSCSVPNNQTDVFAPGGGGWEGWLKLNEPGQDFYSKYLLLEEQTRFAAHAEQQAKIRDVMDGFLPEKECKNETTKEITNPDGTSVTTWVCLDEEIKTPALIVSQYAKKNVDSTYDNIANAEDLEPYLSMMSGDLFNLIMNLGFSNIPSGAVGSPAPPAPAGGGGLSAAEQLCAPFKNAPPPSTAYQDCIRAVQSGENITLFGKKYLLALVDNELKYLDTILRTKQSTANTLAQEIDTLNQTRACQQSIDQNPKKQSYLAVNPAAATVFFDQIALNNAVSGRNIVVRQIIDLQNKINGLKTFRDEVNGLTDKDAITNAISLYRPVFGPGEGQSTVEESQQELVAVQQNLIRDQEKLLNCQNIKAAVEAFQIPEVIF